MSGKQIFEGAQVISESSQRRLQNISESPQQRLQNISESSQRRLQNISESSQRRLQNISESSQRCLQNISESSQRRLQNISEFSSAMTFSWVSVSLTAADDAIVSLGDFFLVDCSSLTILGLAWTGTGVELTIEAGSPNGEVGDG